MEFEIIDLPVFITITHNRAGLSDSVGIYDPTIRSNIMTAYINDNTVLVR